jgi:predicted membrane-bound dolichyl-phosphate-mannose-protein mannosyltransferase
MMGTALQLSVFKEKMPDCLCGNGEKAIFICIDEKCEHFKSLKSRLSKERYYCEDCMNKFHDHRPTHIIKKTFEVGQKWLDQDSMLVNIEKQFKQNMHEYMDLITHYEDFADNH